jgi:hypothetical protein
LTTISKTAERVFENPLPYTSPTGKTSISPDHVFADESGENVPIIRKELKIGKFRGTDPTSVLTVKATRLPAYPLTEIEKKPDRSLRVHAILTLQQPLRENLNRELFLNFPHKTILQGLIQLPFPAREFPEAAVAIPDFPLGHEDLSSPDNDRASDFDYFHQTTCSFSETLQGKLCNK